VGGNASEAAAGTTVAQEPSMAIHGGWTRLRRLMCSNFGIFGTGKIMENPSDPSDSGSQWFTLGLHVT
jgi:hypothetical protein